MDTRLEIQLQKTTNTLKISFQQNTYIKWQIFAVAEPQQFTWVLEAEATFFKLQKRVQLMSNKV